MSVSQQSDTQVLDLSGRNSSSTEISSHGAAVRFEDIDSPFPTILFVDSEPRILEACRLLFEVFGLSILTADSGEKALDLLQAEGTDAVVQDYLMPGMDGDRIRVAHGKIPIILSSGCSSLPQRLLEIVNASVDQFAGPGALLEALEQELQAATDEDRDRGRRRILRLAR